MPDLYWPHLPFVLEVDSYRWHGGPSRLSEDRLRDTELTLARIPFVRFTYDQVASEPEYVVRTMRSLLGAS